MGDLTCKTCGAPKRVAERRACERHRQAGGLPRCGSRAVQLWKRRHPDKVWAHRQVRKTLKRGRLMPEPCADCGSLQRKLTACVGSTRR
jgi:hypothetical protein